MKKQTKRSYCRMASHGGLVSAPKLKLAISEAQSEDPTTDTLPPDQWNLIKLPAEMPKAESADVEVSCEFIIVDKITCGLLDGNDLTTTFGEMGRLTSIVMHPPADCDDASEYWERRAVQMTAARDKDEQCPSRLLAAEH